MGATERVREAISRTRNAFREHWEALLKQRSRLSESRAGSGYDATEQEIESLLGRAEWREATHPDVFPGCSAFVADIPGYVGVVKIADLPPDAELELRDGHKTGKVECLVRGVPAESRRVSRSWLILGQENGMEVVFTFHPGEPVRPSVMPAEGNDGRRVARDEALRMGFVWAKVAI